MVFKKGHKINLGRKAWNKGIPMSEEQKEKQRESMKGRFTGNKHPQYKHGMNKTRFYRIWCGIKSRCYNKNETSYPRYGGKGITMCDRWKNSFVNFLDDMKEEYFDEAQIDRIDNSLGYSPENCRWVNLKQQANNKSSVILYEFNGKKMNASDWGKELCLSKGTILARIKQYGWDIERALSTKKKKITCIFYDKERKKYRVIVCKNNKKHFIGRFETREEAILAKKNFLNN